MILRVGEVRDTAMPGEVRNIGTARTPRYAVLVGVERDDAIITDTEGKRRRRKYMPHWLGSEWVASSVEEWRAREEKPKREAAAPRAGRRTDGDSAWAFLVGFLEGMCKGADEQRVGMIRLVLESAEAMRAREDAVDGAVIDAARAVATCPHGAAPCDTCVGRTRAALAAYDAAGGGR